MASVDIAAPGADRPDEHEISGSVVGIVYRNEETCYTVCAVHAPGRPDPVTVVGKCAAVWVGETLKAAGQWVRHPQHGFQFQADTITCIPPTSAKGIERYLGSGMIRGIGKEIAARLVAAFGDDVLRIIEHESQRLEEVDGIGRKRRKLIKESWQSQKAVRDIMIFLQSHGVGPGQAGRIYREYGTESIAIISANPYRLCADVWGIGFKTADAIAQSVGIPKESPTRARAGLVYTLDTTTADGHCYCPEPELLLQAQALLDIPVETLAEALAEEITQGRLVREQDRIYLAAIFRHEQRVADRLRQLLQTPLPHRPIQTEKAIPWAEQVMGLAFSAQQRNALDMALSNKVSIITGGPGVGKTTIIRALVDVFAKRGLNQSLGAPTGRAAKRMEEATRMPARTLHRMLKFVPQLGGFEHTAANPLVEDVFIIDEVSMIDLPLMSAFLDALPDAAVLVLVGDVDQLPSVGPGNVLRDMLTSGVIPSTRLDLIFRQERTGWIVRNAHHVNRGEPLELPPPDTERADFHFIETATPEDTIRMVVELLTRRIPQRFGFNPLSDVQVLTPMKRNQLGADNLNAILQDALNPPDRHFARFGRKYAVGDRVMQIRNNYDKLVFNGDIGRITALDPQEQTVAVDFDGAAVTYQLSELDELVHAYACSIHKSQGSEYPAVIILLATQHFKLLQRNLLYTALTRGKQLVCLVGSRKAVHIAIRNNEIRLRRTTLHQRLQGQTPDRFLIYDPEMEP